jgi:hypothetical protein
MHSLSVRDDTGGHTFQRFNVKENVVVENPLPTTYISRKSQSLFGLARIIHEGLGSEQGQSI